MLPERSKTIPLSRASSRAEDQEDGIENSKAIRTQSHYRCFGCAPHAVRSTKKGDETTNWTGGLLRITWSCGA
uniref:Uncharacterized protein n=1 Tax=Steinernema glaseri TaxID=37863 RepID=A0A1I8AI85_9BILA